MADALGHQANLALAPFVKDDLEAGGVGCWFGVNHRNLGGRGSPSIDEDAAAKILQRLLVGDPPHHRHILLLDAVARVSKPLRQFAVVGHDQEALGVHIQPPDWLQLDAEIREVAHDRRPVLRIG